ncbi:MAG: hypothetical protein AAFO70_02855 [Pseudomonadota bacterium]
MIRTVTYSDLCAAPKLLREYLTARVSPASRASRKAGFGFAQNTDEPAPVDAYDTPGTMYVLQLDGDGSVKACLRVHEGRGLLIADRFDIARVEDGRSLMEQSRLSLGEVFLATLELAESRGLAAVTGRARKAALQMLARRGYAFETQSPRRDGAELTASEGADAFIVEANAFNLSIGKPVRLVTSNDQRAADCAVDAATLAELDIMLNCPNPAKQASASETSRTRSTGASR